MSDPAATNITPRTRYIFLTGLSILSLWGAGCADQPVAPVCQADLDCTDADPCTADRCVNGTCRNPIIMSCMGMRCPEAMRCDGRECGPDPVCGESCGTCSDASDDCMNGVCVPEPVACPNAKDCTDRACGLDPVCGESCGDCGLGEVCVEGACAIDTESCPGAMDCSGRMCGIDPICGERCGVCPEGQSCNTTWQCEPNPVCTANGVVSGGGGSARFAIDAEPGAEAGSCGGAGAEVIFRWVPFMTSKATISLCGASLDTVLYVRRDACNGEEVVCNDDGCGRQSVVELSVTAGQTYYIIVDSKSSESGGSGSLNVEFTSCEDICSGRCGEFDGCSCPTCPDGTMCRDNVCQE